MGHQEHTVAHNSVPCQRVLCTLLQPVLPRRQRGFCRAVKCTDTAVTSPHRSNFNCVFPVNPENGIAFFETGSGSARHCTVRYDGMRRRFEAAFHDTDTNTDILADILAGDDRREDVGVSGNFPVQLATGIT